MISSFSKLNDREVEAMFRAPLLACILIAGADGKIDRKEIQKAIQVAKKTASKSKHLLEFYKSVETDFEDKLKVVLQTLPLEVDDRNKLITQELSSLNAIFPKLVKSFAAEFYQSLLNLATKIAASSGGVLGINAIGEEEALLVGLSMIKKP